jgi:transposase
MNIHKLARLTPFGREVLVQRVAAGVTVAVVAREAGVSRPTVYKWCRRAEEQTPEALHDRASTPHHSPQRLVRYRRRQIEKRRRQRWSSRRIAQKYDLPISTVVTEIRRLGLNRLASLEPPRPMVRYERERPGELVHLDIKKLGKNWRVGHRIHGNRRTRVHGIGWEYTHVAIDDHSRLSYAEVLADETAETTAGFLRRAVTWYAAQGIAVERLLTDNGSAYRSPPLPRWPSRSGSANALPKPIVPKPTARPSASFARCSPNGPTPPPTGAPPDAPPPYRPT